MTSRTNTTMSNLALKANWMKPVFKEGNFVNRSAAIMMAIKGITAFFTALFNKINIPQTISSRTTIYNMIWG